MKLNLMYFIMAADRPMLWYNLRRLKAKLGVFNGTKSIVIAVPGNDEGSRSHMNYPNEAALQQAIMDSPYVVERIKQFLGEDERTTYTVVPNSFEGEDPHFFNILLPSVESTDPTHFTFYGHTKGIRYPLNTHEGMATALWTDKLYTHALDPVEDVLEKLTSGKFDCYGSVMNSRGGGDFDWCGVYNIDWHYSGAFFWFRHDAIFTLPNWYDSNYNNRFSLEFFLPRLLPEHRAYSPYYLPTSFYNSGQQGNIHAWHHYLNSIGSNINDALAPILTLSTSP